MNPSKASHLSNKTYSRKVKRGGIRSGISHQNPSAAKGPAELGESRPASLCFVEVDQNKCKREVAG
jgi:hypothetical protein